MPTWPSLSLHPLRCFLGHGGGACSCLHQANDFLGCQSVDLRWVETNFRQDRRAMLADARCRTPDGGWSAIEAGCRLGLTDAADARMVELGNELARHYLLVGHHLAAPQHRRRWHVVDIESLQPVGA